MPVIRTKTQGTQSLKDFYDFLISLNETLKITGDSMNNLIDSINRKFPEKTFYALTSHSRLVILDKDDTASDWLVIFSSILPNEYEISALLPDEKSIWPNSRINTKVSSIEKAVEYFEIALKNLNKDKNNRILINKKRL